MKSGALFVKVKSIKGGLTLTKIGRTSDDECVFADIHASKIPALFALK